MIYYPLHAVTIYKSVAKEQRWCHLVNIVWTDSLERTIVGTVYKLFKTLIPPPPPPPPLLPPVTPPQFLGFPYLVAIFFDHLHKQSFFPTYQKIEKNGHVCNFHVISSKVKVSFGTFTLQVIFSTNRKIGKKMSFLISILLAEKLSRVSGH